MRKALYLLVLASVLVAGCASGGTTQMKNSELLRISGVTVTPGTVVAPGEIITIRMKLDNIGQEDVNFVWKNPCATKTTKETCSSQTTPLCYWGKVTSTTESCLLALSDDGKTQKKDNNNNVYIKCEGDFCPLKDIGDKDGDFSTKLLYDHCGDNLYPVQSFTAVTDGSEKENGQLILKPSRSALLEWTLKAPSETTIANMQQECTFRFQINYRAKAETYTYIYFANPDEKNQRTYTNKDMNLRGENVANFGPVYINFETAQDQPIKGSIDPTSTDTTKQNKWTLYATVRNAGDGIGKVVKGSFQIGLPKNSDNFPTKTAITLSPTTPPCEPSINTPCEVKDCTDFSVDNENRDTLKYGKTDDSRLKLYSKASSRFSCTLPAPKVDVLEPYRFISSADYIYTIDKELKIQTVPKR